MRRLQRGEQGAVRDDHAVAAPVEHFGAAQDVEWAIDSNLSFPGNVILLQTRNEVIAKKKAPVDQLLENGARYQDKRPMAQKMWATIMKALQAVGAVPQRAVA